MTLGSYQLAEFVVLKSVFLNLFDQSVTRTLGIYQLAEFAVFKTNFIKLVKPSQ